MNRAELIARMNEVSIELLREKGYISFVDVLLRMGKLAKEDYEAWRLGTIPYLEQAIRLNLSQLKYMLHTLKDNDNSKLTSHALKENRALTARLARK